MMALGNCSVELKNYSELYNANINVDLKQLGNAYKLNVYETQLPSASNEISKKEGTKKYFLHYRYLIALVEFLVLCQITCLRQATAVSIVAMVKSSNVVHEKENFTYSESACPRNSEEVHMDTVLEIEGEFDWSSLTQGYIVSAGFLGYVLTQMPGGVLAESFGAKYTITFGLFVSSACHFISPFVSRVNSNLMVLTQLLRGIGQGLLLASHSVVAANWFPRNERGLLNTIAMAGFAFGSAVGGVATGVICSTGYVGGWSFSYYLFGGLGIFLSFVFYFAFFETPRDHPKISDSELSYIESTQETDMSKKRPATPWRKMFCSTPVYALVIAFFSQYWISFYGITVHPTYLGTILHFPIKEGIFILMTSWASNWLQKNEFASVDRLRKGFSLLCYIGFVVSFLGMYAAGCNKWLSVGINILQMLIQALCFGGCMIVANDMSPRFAGSLMGLTGTISSTSGFILPIVVGFLTNNEQSLSQWNKVFFLSAGIAAIGAFVFCIFGSAEVQPWNFDTEEEYESYKATMKHKKAKNEDTANPGDFTSHL